MNYSFDQINCYSLFGMSQKDRIISLINYELNSTDCQPAIVLETYQFVFVNQRFFSIPRKSTSI